MEHKILWKILKIFGQKCFDYDIGLTLKFLWQGQICFQGFIWEEFIELVEDLGSNINKCI